MVNKGFLKGCKRVFFSCLWRGGGGVGEGKVFMSLVWISKPVILGIEEKAMSLSVFTIVSICAFLRRRHSLNPSLCHLWPFLLFYVTVSRPCPLWEFSPDRASSLAFIDHSLDLMARRALTGLRNIIPTIMIGNMEMELPAMYMMNRFIGICLNGPSAISHDFWK